MVREFENKSEWALILGASSGLGLATAKKLAKHGLNLCLVYRARRTDLSAIEEAFAEIQKEHNVELAHFNVDAIKIEKREEVLTQLANTLKEKGKVKILIHSIAKGNLKPMVSEDSPVLKNDDFHLTMENMAVSLYDWTKAVLHHKLFAEDARVISFTSEGNSKAWKNYAAVSAAKVVLESITRSMALELAPHGIRANCIQAGVCDTTGYHSK